MHVHVFVLDVSPNEITFAFLSTQFPLKTSRDLEINALDADFQATGLTESSYAIAELVTVSEADFFVIRELGSIQGHVKKIAEDWYSLPIG